MSKSTVDRLRDLCALIEALPASPEQTAASDAASKLLMDVQAIDAVTLAKSPCPHCGACPACGSVPAKINYWPAGTAVPYPPPGTVWIGGATPRQQWQGGGTTGTEWRE